MQVGYLSIESTCKCCGKTFMRGPDWVYKLGSCKHAYFCKYTCMTEYRRNNEHVNSKAKVIIQLSEDGRYIAMYKSVKDATDRLGFDSESPIRDVLRHRRKTGYGFLWEYA